MGDFKPTSEQTEIIDKAQAGWSFVVEAGAGTGKTETTAQAARVAPAPRGLYLAYNKAIVTDAEGKFPPHVTCRTAHSLAYAGTGHMYRHVLTQGAMQGWQIARALGVKRWATAGHKLSGPAIASLARRTITRWAHSTDPQIDAKHAVIPASITDREARAEIRALILGHATHLWGRAKDPRQATIRFDHDWYLKLFSLSGPEDTPPPLPYDLILFDECQDADPVISLIFESQPGCQRIAIGDSCQPSGTMVTVASDWSPGNRWGGAGRSTTKQVPIELIRAGDRVVSWDIPSAYLHRSGSAVSGVTERPFDGELVAVRAGESETAYTPDHHCIVRFGEELLGKHFVYMMRRGDDYRIGITEARIQSQGSRIGLTIRAKQEKADAIWILSVHDTREGAATSEVITAWKHGIPDLIFQSAGHMSQSNLDLVWREIGGNRKAATAALAAFGRDVNYPLWSSGQRSLQTRRPTVIRACNLVDGMRMLPLSSAMLSNGKRVGANLWEGITTGRRKYCGPVYSMTVDGDHTYVGDGIFTHNCQAIYEWRGARNAIAKFREAGAPMFPLSVSWRFGPKIADEANNWLDKLDAELRLTGNPGIESNIGPIDPSQRHTVLSRTNAGVLETIIGSVHAGRPVAMVGCDAEVKSLAKACVKLHGGAESDHQELIGFATWEDLRKFVKGPECSNPTLRTLVRLSENHGVSKISAALQACVDEKDAHVIASTAHRSKGRQWSQVIIGEDFAATGTQKQSPEEKLAEMRLSYVAVTRARNTLDLGGLSEGGEARTYTESETQFNNFRLF